MQRIIFSFFLILVLSIVVSSCSKKRSIEERIDGLWEVQFHSQEEAIRWYDSCKFMDNTIFFSIDDYVCSMPGVWETIEDRNKENHKGHWFVSDRDSLWTITIEPQCHILRGEYNISFYKDSVIGNWYGEREIAYFMRLENKEWNLVCKKVGIIINTW